MRIVAGELGGRIIESPDSKTTRPTTDRVRESIFSSVYSRKSDLSAVKVLDAFAGSGALGIEALSRGAKSCLFFERDQEARGVLDANLKSLGLKFPRVSVRPDDVFDYAAKLNATSAGKFGLVMLDPPYSQDPRGVLQLVSQFAEADCLEKNALVVYEHTLENKASVGDLVEQSAYFELSGQKKYGKIGVTYLKYVGD